MNTPSDDTQSRNPPPANTQSGDTHPPNRPAGDTQPGNPQPSNDNKQSGETRPRRPSNPYFAYTASNPYFTTTQIFPRTQPSRTRASTTLPFSQRFRTRDFSTRSSDTQTSSTQPPNPQASGTQPSNTQPSNTQPSITRPSNTQASNTQASSTQASNTQASSTVPLRPKASIPQPAAIRPSNTQSLVTVTLPLTPKAPIPQPAAIQPSNTQASITPPPRPKAPIPQPDIQPSNTQPSNTQDPNTRRSNKWTHIPPPEIRQQFPLVLRRKVHWNAGEFYTHLANIEKVLARQAQLLKVGEEKIIPLFELSERGLRAPINFELLNNVDLISLVENRWNTFQSCALERERFLRKVCDEINRAGTFLESAREHIASFSTYLREFRASRTWEEMDKDNQDVFESAVEAEYESIENQLLRAVQSQDDYSGRLKTLIDWQPSALEYMALWKIPNMSTRLTETMDRVEETLNWRRGRGWVSGERELLDKLRNIEDNAQDVLFDFDSFDLYS